MLIGTQTWLALRHSLKQRSPTFLAPRTDFVEDNFSMDQVAGDGFGMFHAHYVQAQLLLCDLFPNRPGGWGPLSYSVSSVSGV